MSGGAASKGTKAVKDQEQALKELRKELRRKISLVDADLRLGNKSQAEAEQSIKKIKQWAEAQGAFNRETLIGAQNLKTFANAQGRAKNDFRGMAAVTGRANQVLFDLNQGLQDVPFGMRGIGNNIPFVVEGFRRFGKAAREQGISPLKGFISAMMSPAGLIGTAAAVIPTIITLAAHWDEFLRMWGFGKTAANEYKEAVGGVIEQLGSLQSEINKFRGLDSLFDVEENLEQVRFLALLEEDVKDRQRQLLDEAGFKGGIAEALGGRGQALLSPEQQAEFDRLEELHNQTLNKRLDLETKIKVAKDAQTLPTVKKKELQKEIGEQLEKADKLEKEALKRKKKLLEFEIEVPSPQETPEGISGLDIGKETELLDQQRIDRINEQNKQFREQLKVRQKFSQEAVRISQQAQLAQVSGFEQEKLRIEQKFLNKENQIRKLAAQAGVDATDQIKQLELIKFKQIEGAKTEAQRKEELKRRQLNIQTFQAITGTAQDLFGALMQLNQAQTDNTEQQARKRFEQHKNLSVASAVISSLEAFTVALSDAEIPPIAREIRAGLILAAGIAKVAAIEAQEFNSAGASGSSGSSAGGGGRSGGDSFTRRTSNRFDKVSFLTPPKQQPVIINVTSKTNALELAWEVRNGEAEIKSDKL